jgi:uncharacterized membrane protein
VIAWLRLLLLAAYVALAHYAGALQSPLLAVLALADLVLLVLIEPLLRPRLWAWLALAVVAAGLAALSRTSLALLPLLLVPPLFTAIFAWCFARSLRAGRVPLITKVVAALYGTTPEGLSPRHRGYTRGLTATWAGLLAALTALNLVLALVAVPGGILPRLGMPSPWPVTEAEASLIANVGNYGLLIGFSVLEYLVRKRVFPVRPYGNVFDFARRMAALGPAFWRDFFR